MTLTRTSMLAVLLASAFAFASPGLADEPRPPQTVEEHQTLSRQYEDKAATQRKEAAFHRKMADDYQKRHANPKLSSPPGHVAKMLKHCGAIARAAETLAGEYERAAEYHKFRAKELQGK